MTKTVDAGVEERLAAALCEYYAQRDSGQPVAGDTLIERFPDVAEQLRDFLDGVDRVDRHIPGATRHRCVERQPDIVGEHSIERELGRGGMGVVYEARHRTSSRRVALKMIRSERLTTPEHRERFRIEIQAVAALDHPHIVPIFEAGEFEDCPYFTMKLLEGGPLSGRLAEYRSDPRAAARIGFTIAKALDEAHTRGILHRDVKPQNILLDASGTAYLTDFGLAKLSGGDLEVTRSGATIGSPHYMAPEQARGRSRDVTTASDVYGLGAALYALLTGRPPFEADSLFELLHMIQFAEPEPPSRLNPSVPADLEVICLRCLRKERSERYPTAGELADDLQAFLHDLPIRARPLSGAERAWRWCRRNRGVAALSSLLAAALVAGAATSTVFWWKAESRLAEATSQKKIAESAYRLSRTALEESVRLIVDDPRFRTGPLEPIRLEVMAKQVGFHERFVRAHGNDPQFAADLGNSHLAMAHLANEMGEQDRASTHFREALTAYKSLIHDAKGLRSYGKYVATCWTQIACIDYDRTHQPENAEQAYRNARAILDRTIAVADDDPELPMFLAETLRNLGCLHRNTGRPEQALVLHQDGVAAARSAWRGCPTVWTRASLAVALGELGNTFERLKRVDEARDAFLEAETHFRGALAQRPRETAWLSSLAYVHSSLASIYSWGDLPASESQHQKAVDVWKELVRDHPDVPGHAIRLAETLGYYGDCLREMDRLPDADATYAEVLSLLAGVADPGSEATMARQAAGYAHYGLGLVRLALRQESQAVTELKEAATIYRELTTRFPQMNSAFEMLADVVESLAGVCRTADDPEGLLEWLKQARDCRRALRDLSPQNAAYGRSFAQSCAELADLLSATGRAAEAQPFYREALQEFGVSPPTDESQRATLERIRMALAESDATAHRAASARD